MSRKLALSVVVDGQLYEAGSEPPAEVAKGITNADAWEPAPDAGEVGHTGDKAPFRSKFDQPKPAK